MKSAAAKRLAAKVGAELWWDRYTQLWTITDDADDHTEHLSAGCLRGQTDEQFKRAYLAHWNDEA